MPISLGRGWRSSSVWRDEPNPALRELRAAASERFTGALEFEEPSHGSRAHVFLYEGAVYAVELAGFHVDPMSRLVSAGLLDPEASAMAGQVMATESEVVQDGLVGIDAVARVHQEFLLAGVGAVIGAQAPGVGRVDDAVTSALCTVPVALEDILEAVALRRQRMDATWALVSTHVTAARAVLRVIDGYADLPGDLPELQAFARGVDSVRSVDAVAGGLGLTRAEAVHLAATLVAAGLTEVEAQQANPPHGALLVPEAFGELGIQDQIVPTSGAAASGSTAGEWMSVPRSAPAAARLEELERRLADAIAQQAEATARVESLARALEQARTDVARSAGHV